MKNINVSFKEEQRFDQWWMKAILIGTLLLLVYASYVVWNSSDINNNIGAFIFTWVSYIFGLVVIIIAWFWKLTTRIDNYGITVKCPFVHKKVNWDEIEKLEVLDYGFVGGWGIRIGTKYGTAYNTSGSKGMAVVLKNGKKFLIGTQKENDLKKIVEKWKNI
jgi:hypothetical protein